MLLAADGYFKKVAGYIKISFITYSKYFSLVTPKYYVCMYS